MGLQEKPTDVEGPRARTPPGGPSRPQLLPRNSQHHPRCRAGGAIARWVVVGRSPLSTPPLPASPHPNPPLGLGGTGTPRRPHPTQPFQAFSLCPPGEPQMAKLLTGGLTAPAPPLTPLTARHRPHPSLERETERALGTARTGAPVPSPASRTPLFRDLPCRVLQVGDQTESHAPRPRRAGRSGRRGRAAARQSRRADPRFQTRRGARCPWGTHRHYSSLARCLFSVLVQAMIDHQR